MLALDTLDQEIFCRGSHRIADFLIAHRGTRGVGQSAIRPACGFGTMLRNILSRLRSRIGRRGRQPQVRQNGQFQFRQVVERLEDRTLLTNDLFVITLGFQPIGNFPSWVYDMATAINNRLSDKCSTEDVGGPEGSPSHSRLSPGLRRRTLTPFPTPFCSANPIARHVLFQPP